MASNNNKIHSEDLKKIRETMYNTTLNVYVFNLQGRDGIGVHIEAFPSVVFDCCRNHALSTFIEFH